MTYVYSKTLWKDKADGIDGTIIDAAKLNNMESGIYNSYEHSNKLNEDTTSKVLDVSKEVIDARNGEGTLKINLQNMEDRMTENIANQYIEMNTDKGSMTINNCYNGQTRDMLIKGRTTYIQTCKPATSDGGHLKVEGDVVDGKTKEVVIKGRTTYIQTCKPSTSDGAHLKVEGDVVDGKTKEIVVKGRTTYIQTCKPATASGEHLKVEGDIADGKTKEIVVKGRTLQNLHTFVKINSSASDIFNFSGDTYSTLLKPNTQYTMCILNRIDKIDRVYMIQATINRLPLNQNGTALFTTKSNVSERSLIHFYTKSPSSLDEVKNTRCILLEGDYTSNPPKHYFEGVKSLGETEGKVITVSKGKNLSKISKFNVDTSRITSVATNINLPIVTIQTNITLNTTDNGLRAICRWSDGVTTYQAVSNTSGLIRHVIKSNPSGKILSGLDLYIESQDWQAGQKIECENIMLICGDSIDFVNYEPYRSDKKEALLSVSTGIRGLLDAKPDIYFDNGDILKRVNATTFNGTENWTMYSLNDEFPDVVGFHTSASGIMQGNEARIMCDVLPAYQEDVVPGRITRNVESICTGSNNLKYFKIVILRSKLQSLDANCFKQWLAANNITIWHMLEVPILHKAPVPADHNINSFKGLTHYSCDNKIAPSGIDVYYPVQETETNTWTKHNRIESVGDAEENKVNILSTGKSLVKFGDFAPSANSVIQDLVINGNNRISWTHKSLQAWRGFTITGLNPLKTYTVSFKLTTSSTSICETSNVATVLTPSGSQVRYPANKNTTISRTFNGSTGISIKTISNATIGDNHIEFSQLQLEEGTSATTFEEYREEKKDILLPIAGGSKGLLNSVCDEQLDNGDFLQKVGKVVVDGSEDRWAIATASGQVNTITFNTPHFDYEFKSILLNDRFLTRGTWNSDTESVGFEANYYKFRINVSKEKLETPDLDGFKKWLQANPVTVYCELTTPVLHKAPTPVDYNLNSFKNTTHYSCTNKITPSGLEVYYPINETETSTWTKHNKIESVGDTEENKVCILSENLYGMAKTGTNYETNTPFEYYMQGLAGRWTVTSIQSSCLKTNVQYKIVLDILEFTGDLNKLELGVNWATWEEGATIKKEVGRQEFIRTCKSNNHANAFYVQLINTASSLDTIRFKLKIIENNKEAYDKKDVSLPVDGGVKGLRDMSDEQYSNGDYLQRIKRIVLDGSEDWMPYNPYENTLMFFIDKKDSNYRGPLICSNFNRNDVFQLDVEGAFINPTPRLFIRINKSKLETQDVAGFKKWLQDNPTVVYYELETPVLHKATEPTDHNINSFKGTTHYSCTNKTKPSGMEVYYPIAEVESNTWTKHNRIESVGDTEENKISIVSCGKNLFDSKNTLAGKSFMESGSILFDDIDMYVEKGKNYFSRLYFKDGSQGNLSYLALNFKTANGETIKSAISGNINHQTNGIVRFEKSAHITNGSLYWNGLSDYNGKEIAFLQFEVGDSPTAQCEVYMRDKKDIILPVDLGCKGLPSGICDEQYCNGDYIQNVTRFKLTDVSRSFVISKYEDPSKGFWLCNSGKTGIDGGVTRANVMCDNIPSFDSLWDPNVTPNIKFGIDISGTDSINIRLPIDRFKTTQDCQDFIDTCTVWCKLKNHALHKAVTPTNLNLESHKGVTNIICETKVAPKLISTKVPVNAPATIAEVRTREQDLESKNTKLEYRSIEIENKNRELENRSIDLETKNKALENRSIELETKSMELESKNLELENRSISLENKNKELEDKSIELENMNKALENKSLELEGMNKELNIKSLELESKNIELEYKSYNLTVENEMQQLDIDTNMLATIDLFEMIIGATKSIKGGDGKMVEVYVSMIIKGKKKLEDVPAIIRPQVEQMLKDLGVIS